MSKFRIYKASAGSGKTYSLVYEYLKILIDNPNEYKHILAVTFTNDATEEMKSRVLSQLKILVDNPTSSPYIGRLEKECGVEVFHIQKRAAESLENILHDYSNFNISTIDTFFQKILRAFAKDIGLSAAYNLQLDSETAIQQITEKLISTTTNQSKQSKWLMKAAIEKIEEGKSWNIREELKELFKETLKENYQVKEEQIKESFQNENGIEDLQLRIKKEMVDFESNLSKMAEECNALLSRFNLTRSSFSGKERSFYGWVIKLSTGDFSEPTISFINALDNVEKWYTKSGEATIKEAIIQVYDEGMNKMLNELYHYYVEGIGKYNSNFLIRKNLSYFVMFESMAEEMMKYKSENDILFISDTNQFINEVIGDNDESFIFEKAGNYFHHYLIDEFQDTSQLQWNNFKPLISNAVSQGHTSLVVGDVKQSIYRFRNGDWRLLHEQAANEITYHEIIPLKENHRSLENIIQFNNSLYQIAPAIVSNIYQHYVEVESDWSSKFVECYTDQEQLVPEQNKNSGGYVKLKVFNKLSDGDEEEDGSTKAQQLNELVADMDDALKRGYRPSDIAILVFTKKEAYLVSSHLRKYVEENNLSDQINIVTQSSLNISNSHTVRLIIAALKYLSNKKDQVSLTNVFSEYYQYFLKEETLSFLEREHNEKMQEFIRTAVIVKSLPLQILVDHVIRFFQLESEINEAIFLQHFKDAVYDYLRKNADDLSNFIEWWEESFIKFQVEVPQNERSLEIITIHKSKGLEFDLVFIPFASWAIDSSGNQADTLWLDINQNGIKTLPVKYDKKMQHSLFNEDYLETKFYNYLDKLNLLYVATTRAIRELYIYSDKPKSFSLKDFKPNIRTIFNHILQQEYPLNGPFYLPLEECRQLETQELIVGERTLPNHRPFEKGIETIQVGHHSNNIFETLAIKQQSTDLRDVQNQGYDESKHSGITFHYIIANSNSLEEANKILNKLLLQRKIKTELYDRFKMDLKALFSNAKIRNWLENYASYSEYSFCLDDKILKPDKFFVNENECIVIDFKTGKSMPEYTDQVMAYCNAVTKLFKRPVKGYIYYTQTGKFESVA